MLAATLRDELTRDLLDFAWGQWAQLGVSGAAPPRAEQRVADPEALMLFTLDLARDDPRLFDEVLDWLSVNDSLISVHRLRGLCVDQIDRSLVDAALNATARRPAGGRPAATSGVSFRDLERLFCGLGPVRGGVDDRFARVGWARERFTRSHKSQGPQLDRPIAFVLRLRRIFGLGVRAEVMRVLLTVRAPSVPGRLLAEDAGFAGRNVREALQHLEDAGVVRVVKRRDERYYSVDVAGWAIALGIDGARSMPFHFDWVPVFRVLTRFVRWLRQPGLDDLSPYLRASGARTLIAEVAADLDRAGVPPRPRHATGDAYWGVFVEVARQAARHVHDSTASKLALDPAAF